MVSSMMLNVVAFAIVNSVQVNPSEPGQDDNATWAYVTDDADGVSGGIQPLWLTEKWPDDFECGLQLPKEKLQFSSFQYGSAASRFVTVILVQDDAGPKLYVDSNRDRQVTEDELVPESENQWLLELDAEFASVESDQPTTLPRLVRFELSRFGESIRMSTIGFLSGTLEMPSGAGELISPTLSARVSDADGNGRFGDADDLMWVDANGDGAFDPFLERIPLRKGFRLDDRRYQFATDETGSRVEMNLVQGTGTIEFLLNVPADIVSSQMTLVSKDGTTVPLAFKAYSEAAETSVPVGQYRISSLAITLSDSVSGQKWNYAFSALRKGENAVWYDVTRGDTTVISPVEELDFSVQIHDGQRPFREGNNLFVSPLLTTESGLYINNCWQGEVSRQWMDDGRGATIRLSSPSLPTPIVTTSGFR